MNTYEYLFIFIHIHTWNYLAKPLSRSNTYIKYFLCTYYGVGAAAWHALSHLILTTQSGKCFNNFYFTGEKIEGELTYQGQEIIRWIGRIHLGNNSVLNLNACSSFFIVKYEANFI